MTTRSSSTTSIPANSRGNSANILLSVRIVKRRGRVRRWRRRDTERERERQEVISSTGGWLPLA